MAAKRDYIAEIIERRSRLKKRGDRWAQMTQRLDQLIDIGDFIRQSRKRDVPYRLEIAKYLPIGFVACIEGYFRLVFRDLIDHGSPFRENAATLKEIGLTIEQVAAMYNGQLSLGEFIAHLVSINNLNDLSSTMTKLMGEPFLERIKTVKTDLYSDNYTSLDEEGLGASLCEGLSELFKQRHIFAHELATKVPVSIPRVIYCSSTAFVFMYATETLVQNLLEPSS